MEKEMLAIARLKSGKFEKFMDLCNQMKEWQ